MDMRLKIIIVVFAVVVVFYFFQLVFGMMKKKEHFSSHYYDDVETYEDAPKEKTEEYDLRIALLNEIDKLDISDSKVKGSVMESVFSDATMKKLKDMPKDKRKEEVKNIYQSVVGDGKTVKQEVVPPGNVPPGNVPPGNVNVIEKKPIAEQMRDVVQSASIPMPNLKDYYENDFRNKTSKALDKLDVVITNLQDMKSILSGNESKEPYIAELPTPPPSLMKETIEGFENVRGFAYL
jgi:hypothetical protein